MTDPNICTAQITMYDFVKHIKEYLNFEIKTIFEIGSLNGADSLYLKREFPNADVHAVEGLQSNYNLYLKDLKEIKSHNTIITNYDGFTNWHVKNTNGIHSVFDRGQIYGSLVLQQKCQTLKTLCESLNINSIDLIKIDVEGATLEVLEGCQDLLKTIKMMHIEAESEELFKGQRSYPEVHKFLSDNNFRLIKKTTATITNTSFQYDCIYINNNL
jgi:FkbM family methyltransferase